MSGSAASSPIVIDLPPELSAKASQVPGLPSRLLQFIRMEVAMNERRQERYSPAAKALVEQARDLAAKKKSEGIDRALAMREFQENYVGISKLL